MSMVHAYILVPYMVLLYSCIVQLNLKVTIDACGMGSTRHVFHFTCIQACVIDDIGPIIQNTHVRMRCVHDSLQVHVCILGMHMPNLVCVHLDVHAYCKIKIMCHSVCMHIPALRFTCDKRASTTVWLHVCIKFNLSCTVYLNKNTPGVKKGAAKN